MTGYLRGVFLLNFLVNLLLLLAAGRLCGYPARLSRAVVAGIVGGVHAACCLLQEFHFLGNILWRTVSLGGMAAVAYGLSISGFRRGLVFAVLSLALGGAVTGLGKSGPVGVLGVAAVLCLLCGFGFRGVISSALYVPVELRYRDKHMNLTALHDTGNTLRDPITGRRVLVIGADAAGELTGLTREQLRRPVESIGALPGLRLIPYRSVGTENGFLLALRLQDVKIGTWRGSSLVAFAPERLSSEDAYQALTGGTV